MTTGRRVSREPYRLKRDRRQVVIAVAVAALIIVVTAVAVWILAPNDDNPSILDTTPNVTVPTDTTPTAETPVSTEPPATTVAPGG